MRTALPAPAFLASARERARRRRSAGPPRVVTATSRFVAHDKTLEERARTDINAFAELVMGGKGSPPMRTNLKALWLARHLAENPGARVSIIAGSELGADQLIEATKRAWDDIYLAPPMPTMEQRLADVSDGIWRATLQMVAGSRGW